MDSKPRRWTRLLATTEGRILLAGALLALLTLAGLALSWLWWPREFHRLLAMAATSCLFGRAAGMSLGYALGLGHVPVVAVNMVVETLFVLMFYPLFVFSWHSLLDIPRLRGTLERTHRAAETHRETIRRYGIPGLLLFVWFPFWLTGPVVGSAIGFLIGLRPLMNLSVVLAGTYLAIAGYAVLLGELHNRVAAYGAFAPMTLVALLVVLVLIGHLLSRLKQRHNARD